MVMCVAKEDDVVAVSGSVSFKNVNVFYEQGLAFILEQPKVHFTFSHLNSLDSSGIALLISWVRAARKHKTKITFCKLPAPLLNLCRVYGVESILPFVHLRNQDSVQ